MTERTLVELVKELGGATCQCGKLKTSRQTFCRRCYFQLSGVIRARLYELVGQGYEEAYASAMEILKPEVSDG